MDCAFIVILFGTGKSTRRNTLILNEHRNMYKAKEYLSQFKPKSSIKNKKILIQKCWFIFLFFLVLLIGKITENVCSKMYLGS